MTRLVRIGEKASTAEPRIPLIFIHGIWITPDLNMNHHLDGLEAATRAGWGHFLASPAWQSVEGRFEPYLFYYLSNEMSVSDLARRLDRHIRTMVAEGQMAGGPPVIVAHSMGGLVARSYAQERAGAGTPGNRGSIVIVALATPHHGTQGANCQSRDRLSAGADARDRGFETWGCWGARNTWTRSMRDISALLWVKPFDEVGCGQPNRSDLLWDNYDDLFESTASDANQWLRRLNGETSGDGNLIVYYGTVDPKGGKFEALRDRIYRCGLFITSGPRAVPLVLFRKELIHQALLGSSAMMYFGLYKQGYEPVANDGLVPEKSGAFDGHTVQKRVFCPDHDHLDMLAGKGQRTCSTGKTLFESLVDDLRALADNRTLPKDQVAVPSP